MTKRLILIRHAKSSWDDTTLDDHDRPLNDRGRRQATALGQWLDSRGYVPEAVLCSSAVRTQETCALALAAMQATPPVDLQKGLYHAGPDAMLAALRQAGGDTVMLVGHNPGCAAFASMLARTPPANERFDHYPTGATTVYELAADDWAEAQFGGGQVVDFIVPRELGVD